MKTALILLFLFALASIPGSLVPQRGVDPDKGPVSTRTIRRWASGTNGFSFPTSSVMAMRRSSRSPTAKGRWPSKDRCPA
ncbi:cytochrome c biogenesis protein ResB [Nonomuraea sp. CA-143628]|uniref:cytochrome c biogenesis protein ResB n=1 Tax=Nonomuraea sp. CA-143628 TaxID=3239997 RepID=UPI003D924166